MKQSNRTGNHVVQVNLDQELFERWQRTGHPRTVGALINGNGDLFTGVEITRMTVNGVLVHKTDPEVLGAMNRHGQ